MTIIQLWERYQRMLALRQIKAIAKRLEEHERKAA